MNCIPFLAHAWVENTPLDLHAIYRRGGIGVHLTGPVPVRRHNDYTKRGFEYVCLATTEDVNKAARSLREQGLNPSDYASAFTRDGVFDIPQYIREVTQADAAKLADLRLKIEKFGADAVTEMMRLSDPDYVLPEAALTPAVEQKPKERAK